VLCMTVTDELIDKTHVAMHQFSVLGGLCSRMHQR